MSGTKTGGRSQFYSTFLTDPSISKFIRSISNIKTLNLTLGEEGIDDYFSITKSVSSISSTVQDYYLPMSRKNILSGTIGIITGVHRNLYMVSTGPRVIDTIKLIRQITLLGLEDAKRVANSPGALILENVPSQEQEALLKKFQDTGATVEFR